MYLIHRYEGNEYSKVWGYKMDTKRFNVVKYEREPNIYSINKRLFEASRLPAMLQYIAVSVGTSHFSSSISLKSLFSLLGKSERFKS